MHVSCRACNRNLVGTDATSLSLKEKQIQRIVRMPASQHTMNFASLSSYQPAKHTEQLVTQNGAKYIVPAKVYWNQMSDRASPSIGPKQSVGVDLKHASYERRLNKLKGKLFKCTKCTLPIQQTYNLQDQIYAVKYKYNVGDTVWMVSLKEKGTIHQINENTYVVANKDGITNTLEYNDLKVITKRCEKPCEKTTPIDELYKYECRIRLT